jgi:uncharacterized membrane protein
MQGYSAVVLMLVLVAAIVAGAGLTGVPVLALPAVAAVLVIWGGARIAARREGEATPDP